MDRSTQAQLAEDFRKRHHTAPVLLLPNAWDSLSARLFVEAGFDAMATTSGGVAWALGYADGEQAPWPEVVAATSRIVRAAGARAVSADIEAGYGASPEEVAAHVGDIIAAGVVGINLEDSHAGKLRPVTEASTRLTAARDAASRAGVPIVINARCDVFLHQTGTPEALLEETLARSRAYLAAGADCIYPFFRNPPEMIARFTAALGAPVNVLGHAGMPDIAALGRMGVARITVGTAQTLAAAADILERARALHDGRDFAPLVASLDHMQAQALFAAPA